MRLLRRRVRTRGHEPARTRRGERGAAAVETALCLVFVVVPLVFGIIEFGAMLTYRQALSQAASEGARATVGAPTSEISSAATSAIDSVMEKQTYLATSCGDGLECVPTSYACGSHTCVSVKVTSNYKDLPGAISFPGLSFALPSSLSFTSTVQVS